MLLAATDLCGGSPGPRRAPPSYHLTSMFTRHEVFKHMIHRSDSEDDSLSDAISEDEDLGSMTLVLHLVDRSFVATSSSLTRLEPIEDEPQDRVVELRVGDGSQSFRWLALTARARLHQLYHREGLVRQREATLGKAGAFLPTNIVSEDPESDPEFLRPNATLNSVLQDGDHVWLTFHQDGKSEMTKWEKDAFFQNVGTMAVPNLAKSSPLVESKAAATSESKQQSPARESIFFCRQFESDSRDYYDSKEHLRRAFETDFKVCVRRSKFLTRSRASLIRRTLQVYYGEIRTTFRYFSASSSGDPFTMSMNEFLKLTRTCKVPDSCMGILWKQTNFNAEDPQNTDHVLERHEFIEMIVRLAHEMYLVNRPDKQLQQEADATGNGSFGEVGAEGVESEGKLESKGEEEEIGGEAERAELAEEGEDEGEYDDAENEPGGAERVTPTDLAGAIQKLMEDHFSPHCWQHISEQAATMYVDPDAFRRDCLYFEEINEVLRARADELYVIYEVYAHKSALRLREFNNALKLMCCEEFQTLFGDCGLLKQKAELTDLDVRRSFAFAQMTCVNSLDRKYKDRGRDQANRATFLEFVEALVRACAIGCMFKNESGHGAKVFLSKKLGPFLDKLVIGLGEAFWAKHKNEGIFVRKIQKKFGKCRNAKVHGPETGRHEADQSPEALAVSLQLRKGSAYRLPPGLSYMTLASGPEKEKQKKKKKKK